MFNLSENNVVFCSSLGVGGFYRPLTRLIVALSRIMPSTISIMAPIMNMSNVMPLLLLYSER